MFAKKNNKRGISTVLTTMIILVASVVLGTGVVIYGTSLFQTGAQQEAITTQGTRLWVNATETDNVSWGAAAIRNSGDKLISVDNIQVRGTAIPFTQWYVSTNQTAVNTDNFQSQLVSYKTQEDGMMHDVTDPVTGATTTTTGNKASMCSGDTGTDGDFLFIDLDNAGTKPSICLQKASGPTSLQPGERMIVYFKLNNGVLNPVDAGSSSSVSIFAGKAGAPTSTTIGNS